MSSGRAGLPGWWSPLEAGSRASLMPGEAGIRAAGISGAQQAPVWHRICSRCARLASCPWAGAPVRCHVSEGQEAGRAGCLEMLAFGQLGPQATAGP